MFPLLERKFKIETNRFLTWFLMLTLSIEPALFAQPETAKQDRYGGALRLASYGTPAPLDPFNVTDTISVTLLDLVFNKLIRWNVRDSAEKDLAESWMVSADGLTYTFHLRRGIRFHDGIPCTAHDVAYSFRLFSDRTISPTYYRYFEKVAHWEAVSDSIFQVRLKEPFSSFLLVLTKMCVIPKHKLLNAERDVSNFVTHPIGTGPFRFKAWESSGRITFGRNPDYYAGKPHLDEVVILPIEKDQVRPAFLRGDIDMAFYLSREHFRDLGENAFFQTFRALSTFSYALIFNFKDELLQNQNVRTALAYTIDRNELIERIESGEGVPANGPFHPESWAFDPEVEATVYNPGEAKSILKQEGFEEAEGTLSRNGKPFVLTITVDRKNEHLYQLAKFLRQQFGQIGIKTELNFYSDYAELIKKVYEERNFQLYLTPYHAAEADVAMEYWYSRTRGAYNVGSYFNPAIENLINSAKKTYDEKKKKVIYYRIHRLIEEDKPALFLYFPYHFFAASKRVEVPEELFSPVIPFHALKDVFISDGKNEERR